MGESRISGGVIKKMITRITFLITENNLLFFVIKKAITKRGRRRVRHHGRGVFFVPWAHGGKRDGFALEKEAHG